MVPQRFLSTDVIEQIVRLLQDLRYGSVQITVHDAQIVHIERVERIRVTRHADLISGGSLDEASPAGRTAGGARPGRERGVA